MKERNQIATGRLDPLPPDSELPHVSATEARVRFGELAELVKAGQGPIVIERYGRPVAVVMDAVDYQRRRGAADLAQIKNDLKSPPKSEP